jgi:membrane protein implicated in regulation of membrane protease activity
MWIHQRTGRNTAVSYRVGTVIFGLLLAATAVWKILGSANSVALLPICLFAVLTALLWRKLNGRTKEQRAERREHRRLIAIERMEQLRSTESDRVADLERLRTKYPS